jgi:hypothetical protein
MMIGQPMLRDVVLAVLLGLPTAALSRPEAIPEQRSEASPLAQQAAGADQTPVERRFGFPG